MDEQGLHLRGLVAGAGGALPLHSPSAHHGSLVAEAHLLAQRLFEVLQRQVTTRGGEKITGRPNANTGTGTAGHTEYDLGSILFNIPVVVDPHWFQCVPH